MTTMTDPGPSLQESPDMLVDDNIDDGWVDQSPTMERNHSQVISCDLPEDFEYERVGGSGMKRRGNKSVDQEERNPKAKLNFPEDSSEEIEILEENCSSKTLVDRTKGLLQLKRKAQSFMRASSVATANTSQSKLDDWVVKSPRKVPTLDVSDDQDVIFIDDHKNENSINRRPGGSKVVNEIQEPEECQLDKNAGPDQPSRRQRKVSPSPSPRKSKSVGASSSSVSNHFLVKTRSGSIRKSLSVRSQKSSDSPLPLLLSQCSTASQDSFCSEAGSDMATPVKSLSDQPGQKTFFCHNLLVQRRTLVHRLDVGHCVLPRIMPSPIMTPFPLPPSMCSNIWTCLDSEEELKELNKEIDESWLAALKLLTKVVNMNRL